MHEGISPALRRGPLSFSHGMPLLNDGVMHDMITSGSMAAASSLGFFTQEEARATEAIAAAARGNVDDHGFGDGAQDVEEEEEEQADLDEEDDTPEPMSTST
jgi:basic membrane lipoprotein Med (substrate-binding protein (PBP1-ABC) superfamily)